MNRHPIVLFNTKKVPWKVRKGEIIGVFKTQKLSDFFNINDSLDGDGKPPPNDGPRDNIHRQSVASIAVEDLLPEREESPDDGVDGDKSALDPSEKLRLDTLLKKYEGIFMETDNKLGLVKNYEHTIEVMPGTIPCNQLPFRVSPEKQDQFTNYCNDLIDQGVLEKTDSGPWSSKSFLVQKSNGGFRLVSDYRYLNENLIDKALNAPRADDSLEIIGTMRPKYFSKLDAAQGFFQIPIRKEDRELTAFIGYEAKYQYKVLPMGLKTAPKSFGSVVNALLGGLRYKCAIAYLDDVLVLSPDKNSHFNDLEKVLEALQKGGLKLKRQKCEFFLQKIEFLGTIVTPVHFSQPQKSPDT